MAKIKVYYDKQGKTITVWFDDPKTDYLSEEAGDEVILMKNKQGKVIGFERLNFDMEKESDSFTFEAIAV